MSHPLEILRKEASLCCSHHRYKKMSQALDELEQLIIDADRTHGGYYTIEWRDFLTMLKKNKS